MARKNRLNAAISNSEVTPKAAREESRLPRFDRSSDARAVHASPGKVRYRPWRSAAEPATRLWPRRVGENRFRKTNESFARNARHGRVALVTGASRGIGRAVALALAASGAHVVALARTQGALEELDDAIRALRPEVENPATLVPCDLRDHAAIDRLGEALVPSLGPSRRPRRQRRRARPLVAAASRRPQAMGRRLQPQRHRELAPDPRARSAAAPIPGRPGRLRHLRRRRAARSCAPIGAPTRSPRRRSTRSPAPTPPRPSTPRRSASCWSIPARLRTRMRASAMPGEDPQSLRTPEELAPKIVAICSPDWRETGKLYDFPHDRVMSFAPPA